MIKSMQSKARNISILTLSPNIRVSTSFPLRVTIPKNWTITLHRYSKRSVLVFTSMKHQNVDSDPDSRLFLRVDVPDNAPLLFLVNGRLTSPVTRFRKHSLFSVSR